MDEMAGQSRPKVHRLPQHQEKDSELYVSRTVLVVCLSLLLAAVIPALWSFSKIDKQRVADTITPEQAQLLSPTADPASESLIVHDDKGQMVGQLAKMPADKERGAINSMSKVDKNIGKELMNIISKE